MTDLFDELLNDAEFMKKVQQKLNTDLNSADDDDSKLAIIQEQNRIKKQKKQRHIRLISMSREKRFKK